MSNPQASPEARTQDPPKSQPPADEGRTKPNWVFRCVMILIVLAGLGYGIYLSIRSFYHESTDDAFIDGTVVQLSPLVSGHVVKLYVDDNQHVAAGAPILEIDPRDYQAQLDRAIAMLNAAKARLSYTQADVDAIKKTAPASLQETQGGLSNAKGALETAKANVNVAESALSQAKARVAAAEAQVVKAQTEQTRAAGDLRRYEGVFKTGGISEWQLDQYTAAAAAADAAVQAAQAQQTETQAGVQTAEESLLAAKTQVFQAQGRVDEMNGKSAGADIVQERINKAVAEHVRAEADVAQCQAQVQQAELNLSYTKIYAPQAGVVTKKNVEVGNFVRPGQALMALVGDDRYVIANFKETQLEKIRIGQPVAVYVDAYPSVKLSAKIDSIQRGTGSRFSLLPAENATGNYVKIVQRVPVKIVFDGSIPDDITLSLGMSVIPEVKVK